MDLLVVLSEVAVASVTVRYKATRGKSIIQIRKAEERGHADHGWLNTYHTFSFSTYQDPDHMHFRSLRVMNEDWVAPDQGFGTHPHQDMEIVTYVLEGALEHKDSMGNGEVLRPGEFQVIALAFQMKLLPKFADVRVEFCPHIVRTCSPQSPVF